MNGWLSASYMNHILSKRMTDLIATGESNFIIDISYKEMRYKETLVNWNIRLILNSLKIKYVLLWGEFCNFSCHFGVILFLNETKKFIIGVLSKIMNIGT